MPVDLEPGSFIPDLPYHRSGGRKSPRVAKSIQHLMDRMTELQNLGLNCDPIQVLMEIAIGQKLVKKIGALGNEPDDYTLQPVVGGYDKQGNPMDVDASTRAKAASELCSYLYPKRKAVEVTGAEGTAITFAVQHDSSPLPGMPNEKLPVIDAEFHALESSQDCPPDGTRDGNQDGNEDCTPSGIVSQPE